MSNLSVQEVPSYYHLIKHGTCPTLGINAYLQAAKEILPPPRFHPSAGTRLKEKVILLVYSVLHMSLALWCKFALDRTNCFDRTISRFTTRSMAHDR